MLKYTKTVILIFILPIILLAMPKKRLVPVDPAINTIYSDFAPSLTSDGKTMVFNSRRGGVNQDIYITHFRDGKWSNPLNLRILNSRYHDETPFITSDGKFIFFASDRDGSLKMARDHKGRVLISYDIYWSENVNGRWTSPDRVPGNVNTVNHERAPSLCLKTETLYYTSWPFGNVKNSRIMKADLVNGNFVNIQKLPSPINTHNQDMVIVPNIDCSGFYFSSRRPGGFGGWDIYFVTFKNGIFGKAVNMGPDINSQRNEFFYYKIGKSIYLCSDRPGGTGKYDIYTLKQEKTVRFLVRNKKTGKPLSATAKLSYAKKDPSSGLTWSTSIDKKSDANGKFSVDSHPSLDRFDITINKKGFLPFFKTIVPDKVGEDLQILSLTPTEKDASFEIHAIHFDFDSAKIRPDSYRYLDMLVRYMKKNRKFRFRIIGHTDLRGSAEYNNKLSLGRARSVKEYLIKKGLDPNRFEIEGAGKSRPKVSKQGPDFDEQNRRTEFKLIGKD